ncbi:MAG: FAD-dependent oxidoreductase [Alkalibacterium sp.]|nr:FAD-dependent oxidoreductase [Alkalibacterium sp.]
MCVAVIGAEKIKARMAQSKKLSSLAVAISVWELSKTFAEAGIEVTVIDALDRVLERIWTKNSRIPLRTYVRTADPLYRTDEMVNEIVGEDGKVKKVITNKGEYDADTVILSAGVRPNTKWLDGIVRL